MKAEHIEWEHVECIFCNSNPPADVVWPDEKRGHIVRCQNCGLAYRNPRRTEEYLTEHFIADWTEARPEFYLEDYRTKNLAKIARWILSKQENPASILDIGSSYGNLLAQFPDSWQKTGLEPSTSACQICRERLPTADILQGTLSSTTLPDHSFDVITMVDTVYYLPYPKRDFQKIRTLLKPSGIALIESQNFSNRSRVYRWMNHRFDDTWMYFYEPRSLEKLIDLAGMKVVARFDLPGHQVGSPNLFPRFLTWSEYYLTRGMFIASKHTFDFIPHFVLVAQLQ